MRTQVRKAFTLVEILIVVVILGILAAIVVPQFTNASADAQVGNVETQLQTIRNQIEMYRVRNNGQYPDLGTLTASDGWGDAAGTTAAARGLMGNDYLKAPPVNPRTGTSIVAAGEYTPAFLDPSSITSTTPGWYFDADTGTLLANGFNEDWRRNKAAGADDETADPWFRENP